MYAAGSDFPLSPCWRILFHGNSSSVPGSSSSVTALAIFVFATLCGALLVIFGVFVFFVGAFALKRKVREEDPHSYLQHTISSLTLFICSAVHLSFIIIFFLNRNESLLQPRIWIIMCSLCGSMFLVHGTVLFIYVCFAAMMPSVSVDEEEGRSNIFSNTATLLSDPLIQKADSFLLKSKYLDVKKDRQKQAMEEMKSNSKSNAVENSFATILPIVWISTLFSS